MFDRRNVTREVRGRSGTIKLHLYDDFGFDKLRQFSAAQIIAYIDLQGLSLSGNVAISQRMCIDLNNTTETISMNDNLFTIKPNNQVVNVTFSVQDVNLVIDITTDFTVLWNVSVDVLVHAT